MTTFTSGLIVGNREFCIFSIEPCSNVTSYHATEIGEAMGYLQNKINQDPENLKEVFTIHRRLFNDFGKQAYIELEKPLHVGIGYIVNAIRNTGVPVTTYYRKE